MIKSILPLVLLLLVSASLSAKKVKGKIVRDTDSVDVTIEVPTDFLGLPSMESMQNKITYYDGTGKKFKANPNELKEYRFIYEGKYYRMCAVSKMTAMGKVSEKKIFLQLLVDGKLKLYNRTKSYVAPGTYGVTPVSTGGINNMNNYVVQKEGQPPLYLESGSYSRKALADYLNDCPDIAQKLRDKEYKIKHAEEVVNNYNATCGK